jgi:hypothetical protein
MGIEGPAKDYIYETFPGAIEHKPPTGIETTVIDMMQYMKSTIPDTVDCSGALANHFKKIIVSPLSVRNGCKRVIACFDLGSPAVKKFTTHTKRYDKRCKVCKGTGVRSFSSACLNDCEGKQPLKFQDGPYLPKQPDKALPFPTKEWYRFSADSRNLRRELYPLIVNELLKFTDLKEGQEIILCGLPIKSVQIDIEDVMWQYGYNVDASENRCRIIPWEREDLPIPFIEQEYHRVFSIRAMPPNPSFPQGWIRTTRMIDMENDIHEADNSVFFFSQFFPGANQMISINDGDAIPIGLLRMAEDFRGSLTPTHTTWLRLPNLRGEKSKFIPKSKAPFDYINLTQLYLDIMLYDPFKESGVQNPVATIVFLIILAGTDFFKNYCKGIGIKTEWKKDKEKRARQKPGIWDTFMGNLETYSHMCQWLVWDMKPDPTAKRRIVIDRELFRLFTYEVYWNRYLFHIKKEERTNIDMLRVRCSKLKTKEYHLPTETAINAMCSRVQWNADYWVNACRNIYVDPFTEKDGKSLYGFNRDGLTDDVSEPLEVDDVYKANFHAYKNSKAFRGVSPSKKQKVVEGLKNYLKE